VILAVIVLLLKGGLPFAKHLVLGLGFTKLARKQFPRLVFAFMPLHKGRQKQGWENNGIPQHQFCNESHVSTLRPRQDGLFGHAC
jgi:hypothetical protein